MKILILTGGSTPWGKRSKRQVFFFFSDHLPLPQDKINTTFSLGEKMWCYKLNPLPIATRPLNSLRVFCLRALCLKIQFEPAVDLNRRIQIQKQRPGDNSRQCKQFFQEFFMLSANFSSGYLAFFPFSANHSVNRTINPRNVEVKEASRFRRVNSN